MWWKWSVHKAKELRLIKGFLHVLIYSYEFFYGNRVSRQFGFSVNSLNMDMYLTHFLLNWVPLSYFYLMLCVSWIWIRFQFTSIFDIFYCVLLSNLPHFNLKKTLWVLPTIRKCNRYDYQNWIVGEWITTSTYSTLMPVYHWCEQWQ